MAHTNDPVVTMDNDRSRGGVHAPIHIKHQGLTARDGESTVADAILRLAEAQRYLADKTYAAAILIQAAIDRTAMAIKDGKNG